MGKVVLSLKVPGNPKTAIRGLIQFSKGDLMLGFKRSPAVLGVLGAALLTGMCQTALAATLCVNPSGAGGCYTTIGAAVSHAGPGDTINVAHGTYNEDVVISQPVSLIGENQQNTIIDAAGLTVPKINGITISASNVVISGFTVQNALAAGIKVTGSIAAPASDLLISNNTIRNNDTAGQGNCTSVEPLETLDCGEGMFLSGVDHSVIANNTITGNAGGIFVTDDTGPNHDNLILENSILRNIGGDCGITLPSHTGKGVYNNTVSGNDSSYNSGPGVGIFAPGPGSKAYGNVVVNNHLRGNANPGVTMHNHAAPGVNGVPAFLPEPVFNDNKIIGNDLSANEEDDFDAATPGPAGINIYSVGPMTGTVISQNTITQEAYDIYIKVPAPASGPAASAHLNSFLPNTVGVTAAGAGSVDATMNWWGCPGGPGSNSCATVSGSVAFAPWLTNPVQTNPGN